MFTIRQNGQVWELIGPDGAVLSAVAGEGGYDALVGELGGLLTIERAQLAMDGGGEEGLLPEPWVSPISWLSEPTGDGRDFSETTWTWRDPNECLIPLMLHTETEVGHFGAQLAGFATEIALSEGTGTMRGRFYDNAEGVAFRDMLLGGRRYGVSVDPGAVEIDFRCVELDDDGFCVEEELVFLAYEVIGLTGTPFPGFARAHVMLDTGQAVETPASEPAEAEEPEADDADEEASAAAARVGQDLADGLAAGIRRAAPAAAAAAGACCDSCAEAALRRQTHAASARSRLRSGVVTAGAAPARPPAAWFADPQLSALTPLTITEDGQVFGHLAPWGQCHVGYQGECVTTPRSLTNYAYFRTGALATAEGEQIPVGRLTVGGGHADLSLSFRGASEHYDDVASAFADVAAGEDAFGIWVAGALRPAVTEETLRVVRSSPPSGDWRPIGSGLEMVAACSVNSGGFPIARVASGGQVLALVAAGQQVMARLAHAANPRDQRLDRLERQVAAMHASATAPARERLRVIADERARQRLRDMAKV